MKKRIYSKDKTPKFIATKPISNSFDLLCQIKQLPDNTWKDFIQNVVWNDKQSNDFQNIISEISNKNIQKTILLHLISIKDFNPFCPDFSLIEKNDYKNLILKKQTYYYKYKNYHKKLVLGNQNQYVGLIAHTSFYDMEISCPFKLLFNSHNRKLLFKHGGKDIFNVVDIFQILNNLEPNKWEHNNSYTAIFVKSGRKSNIHINEIVSILKSNLKN